jgi:hypothetical protein
MTPVEAAQILVDEGFTGWPVVTFGAIGMAESNLNPLALHRVNKPGSPAHLSVDHGWLQINDYWQADVILIARVLHPKRSESMFLADPRLCARIARQIFDRAGGAPKGYERWTTYRTGAHKPHLPAARVAARTIGINV